MKLWDRAPVVVAALAAGALLVRIAWLAWHGPGEITWDGAEYARLAESLANGNGYVGIRGTLLFVFPPLYSLAMIVAHVFEHDFETAGIAVSLLAGAALVVPVYALGARLYDRRAGYAGAALVAVLPFAVQLSTVVLADALFLTLAAAGLACLVACTDAPSTRAAFGAGAFFGLAYLTRPEAVLFEMLAVAVVATIALRVQRIRAAGTLGAAIVIPFCLLAAPYVAFLSGHAGQLRIEGKSALNLDIGLRMRSGMTYAVAADAIDTHLRRLGPELDAGYDFDPAGRVAPDLRERLGFFAGNVVRHNRDIAAVLRSRLFGTIVLVAIAVAGFIAPPWSGRRLRLEIVLLLYALAVVVSLASVYHFWERYALGFVPVFVVWAGRGTIVVHDAAARLLRRPMWTYAPAAAVVVCIGALLFSSKARFTDDAPTIAERSAGTWLAPYASARTRIAGISDQAVFYAGGTWTMLPCAPDDDAALRYIAREAPEYIVLNREYAAERSYVRDWLANGIPDRRAQRVYGSKPSATATIAVYRWTAGHLARARPVHRI